MARSASAISGWWGATARVIIPPMLRGASFKIDLNCFWLLLVLPCFLAVTCGSQQHSEILVVVNDKSPISVAIGDYYRETRGIPKKNLVALSIPLEDPNLADDRHETITAHEYRAKIRDPLEAILKERGLVDSIEIIVTTKGIPLRVFGEGSEITTWLRDVSHASVDAELSLLFSGRDGSAGVVDSMNPYYRSEVSFRKFRRKNPDSALRYLVARLTSYQQELDPESGIPRDLKNLLDRATEEVGAQDEPGIWLIDANPRLKPELLAGNLILLESAAAALRALGAEVVLDEEAAFHSDAKNILGYASWGSNDVNNPGKPYYGSIDGKLFPGRFRPRALSVDFVSTNARTFTEPARYGQSLVADLVRGGAAGATGHVYEPVLSGVPRPHILLTRYAEGVPAVEAFYRSIPYLGWMNIYVGDPLLQVAAPRKANRVDRDGDGIPDASDNCIDIPNANQRDTNGDGFGNICDADVDGDGIVSTSWGVSFPLTRRGDLEWIGLVAQNGSYDPNYDLNGDGKVDRLDTAIAQIYLFAPPGPSGQARSSPR